MQIMTGFRDKIWAPVSGTITWNRSLDFLNEMSEQDKSQIEKIPVGIRIAIACIVCLGVAVSVVFLVRLISR